MTTSAAQRHLTTRLAELERSYATLTDRIAALDRDIGREVEEFRRQPLQERRDQLVQERDRLAAEMARIEQQVAAMDTGAATPAAELQPLPGAPGSSPAETPPSGADQPDSQAPPPVPSPSATQGMAAGKQLLAWALAGALVTGALGLVFFQPLACILEYRLSEAIVGLLVFLAGGAGIVFTTLLSAHLRPRLQALYGGIVSMLVVLILASLILPRPAEDSCVEGRPTATATGSPAAVETAPGTAAQAETPLPPGLGPRSTAPAAGLTAETAAANPPAPAPSLTETPTPSPEAAAQAPSPGQLAVTSAGFFDQTDARYFAWSPDSSAVAIGGSFLYLYDVAGKAGRRVSTDTMGQIAYLPDGSTLVAAPYDGITLWDTATWVELDTLAGSRGSRAMAVAPDGVTLAAAVGDALVLWNLASGESRVLPAGQRIEALAFAPDSRVLAAGGDRLTLWDVGSGSVQDEIAGQKNTQSLAFSPNGLVLAAASPDGVRLWDLAAPERPQGLLAGSTASISSVAFSPDGALLATGGGDLVVRLWNALTGDELAAVAGHSERISQVAFSPDGALLATGAGDGLRLWQMAPAVDAGSVTPTRAAPPATATPPSLSQAAIAPGNAALMGAAGHYDETDARQFAWAPDGSKVAIGGSFLYLYNVQAGTGYRASTDTMGPVLFTPDGATLLASPYGGITRWDVASVVALDALSDSRNVQVFAISPDGATVVAAIGEALRFWDLPSGSKLATVPAGQRVSALAFSPDGRILAAGGDKLTLRDPNTGLVLETLEGQRNVQSLAFSPDSRLLAVASADGVLLWNLATGRPQGLRVERVVNGSSVAFSPNGLVLATGGSDQAVRLWEVATGNELASLPGHTSEVNRVAFSPDGAILASGGGDGLRLWSVAR